MKTRFEQQKGHGFKKLASNVKLNTLRAKWPMDPVLISGFYSI